MADVQAVYVASPLLEFFVLKRRPCASIVALEASMVF